MDGLIIGAMTLGEIGEWAWMIGAVAMGIGFVIFVHELGHFLVAKLCGVKCEKFYIGFDVPLRIGPLALPSRLGCFRWGETEYGIGIIPLGGYVKMLGQDDDPRAAQAEAERIRIRKNDATGSLESSESAATLAGEEYVLDPRSFPAKTVPQRMAIISAGVVMNLIFAVIFATFAFRGGVSYTPCEVGLTVPGSPAWKAGLEPGDRIVKLGQGEHSNHLRFTWDLRNAVLMAGGNTDLPIVIRRPDGTERGLTLRPVVHLEGGEDFPMIGVSPASTNQLAEKMPALESSPAGQAVPPLQGKDTVVAVNGVPTANGHEVRNLLARQIDQPVQVTVERIAPDATTPERVEVTVGPNPLKDFGFTLEMGPISGIRPGSVAETAGIQMGDRLATFQGEPITDPLVLAQQVRSLVGQALELGIQRGTGDATESLALTLTPGEPTNYGSELSPGLPLDLSGLGIVLPLVPRIVNVAADSPAAQAGLAAGDQLVAFQFTSPDPATKAEDLFFGGKETPFSETSNTWLFVLGLVQVADPGTELRLVYERAGKQDSVTLKPVAGPLFFAERGFRFTSLTEVRTAESWTEAASLGLRQTKEDLYRVAEFLQKLVTGYISPSKLGGPLSIAAVAGSEAAESLPRLLIFLTFLSANLAILNFLPIPALDGGHMMFLLAEWVLGRPVDERVQMALTLAGVVCLLSLMVFVSGMDIQRLFF
jgi:regulator of sigma E protease